MVRGLVRTRATAAAVMMCALSALVGCSKDEVGVAGAIGPEVVVSRPLQQTVRDFDEFTGRFAAVDAVQVQARVDGYLDQVHFNDGALEKRDQLLFTIDPRPFQARVEQQRAAQAQARSDLALARADAGRASRLLATKMISVDENDRRQAALQAAEAQVEAASALLRQAELELGFTAVKAPVSGRISRRQVTPGNLVDSDTVLTSIVSLDPIYLYFTVSEADALKYQRQGLLAAAAPAPVSLRLNDEKAFDHQGSLDFVDNQLDQQTGTLQLRAVFGNPVGLFKTGAFARVRFANGPEYAALLVPESALGSDQGHKFALVVDAENKVQYRPVQAGAVHGALRVVKEGLQPTDRIIVSGLQRVRPGMVVAPREQNAAVPGAAAPEA